MRRGERSTATATYFLVRQRELRKGAIKNYRAMLPYAYTGLEPPQTSRPQAGPRTSRPQLGRSATHTPEPRLASDRRPPPPRLPTARRRPVPANLARAAAKLPPPTLPQLTLPMAGLRIDLAQGRDPVRHTRLEPQTSRQGPRQVFFCYSHV